MIRGGISNASCAEPASARDEDGREVEPPESVVIDVNDDLPAYPRPLRCARKAARAAALILGSK